MEDASNWYFSAARIFRLTEGVQRLSRGMPVDAEGKKWILKANIHSASGEKFFFPPHSALEERKTLWQGINQLRIYLFWKVHEKLISFRECK